MPTKDEPHHQLRQPDQPSTTVIHHYEDDQTLLARWLQRGLQKGPKFWFLLAGTLVVAVGLGYLLEGLWAGQSTTAKAWMALTEAKSSDQQVKVSETYAKTPPARWALLEAASAVYSEGYELLATKRDEASPLLKRAYTLYEQAYNEANKTDSDLARLAAFGMARTLEASNDLSRAIDQYKLVATTWPNTDEGKRADALARALQNKKNAEFYKWLASYKPPEMTLPPLGKGILDLGLPESLGGGTPSAPSSGGGVPAGLVTPPATATEKGSTELPKNVFELPPPPPTPPADTKAGAPATGKEAAPAPKSTETSKP